MKQLLQDLKDGRTHVADVPAPTPTAGQVLVRVRASAVSAGTERMLVDFAKSGLLGKARRRPDLVRQVLRKARRDGIMTTLRAAQGRLEAPLPLGYSCAGVVEAVGEGVEDFAVGDRVACAGAGYANHAEFAAVPQNLCALLPADASWDEAALTTLGAIALQGFRLSEAKLGETVAVIGLGLLGQLAARLAKAAGCRVFGVDLDEARLKVARAAGVEAVLRAEAERAGAAFTDGRGFDAILIAADGATNDPIELSAALARERGVVVAVGNILLGVPRDAFYRKELTLKVSRSYGPGRYDPAYEEGGLDYPYAYVRWTEQRNMAEFVRLMSGGALGLGPIITHRLPIASGTEAYALISGGDRGALGVVLEYPDDASATTRVDLSAETAANPGEGVGVLGAGAFAAGVMLPAIKASGASLRGIASPSGTHAKNAAERFGFAFAASKAEEVLNDAGTATVVILTRHDLHAEQVCAALAAGKNVFVEKPLCLSAEELKRIDAARRTAKGILAVGFNRRFAPMTETLKAAFKDVAGPKAVQIRVNAGALPPGHWAADPAQGGRLIGEGCHFIDWANFVVGAAPVGADARALGRKPGEQDWVLRLHYADGSAADILYTSEGDAALGKERYEVHGGGVSAVMEDFRRLSVYRGGKQRTSRDWTSADKGHARQWNAFFAAVRAGGPACVSWDEIALTTRAALAARESLRRGAPVEVEK
ncbi:MAG: Gfo/Idh/MocA family oxidoreductase [Elusimicrobia bacterium]|nr:Gfo/Idh/MocA family oxidoreductase [Elusimicrobiota bacterium]